MENENTFLPLGSIVILKGALKKLMIISRANVMKGKYFDYGALLYPEGMIDENIAYFNHEDIIKIVSEGFVDEDNSLMVDQLTQAKADYLAGKVAVQTETEAKSENVPPENPVQAEDPFAVFNNLGDDE